MRVSKLVRIVVPLVLLASSAPTLSASAEDPGEDLDDGVLVDNEIVTVTQEAGWILREYHVPLPNASLNEYQGQAVTMEDGTPGCQFSGQDTVDLPDGYVRIEREVGFGLDDCVLQTEAASLTASEAFVYNLTIDSLVPADHNPTTDTETAPSAAGATSLAAGTSRSRWFEGRYEDPPNIDVTRVRAKLSWTYTGSCVTSSWNHEGGFGWFGASGWVRKGHWVRAFIPSGCSSHRQTDVYGKFRNPVFCQAILAWLPPPLGLAWALLQPATGNEYLQIAIRGKADGSYVGFWSVRKWGGCRSLLSFEKRFGSF